MTAEKQNNKEKQQSSEIPELPSMPSDIKLPEIPKDVQKKLDQLKEKIEKFKKEVLKKFDKYIVGISILPPEKKEDKFIEILILVDDSDSQKMSKYELREKLQRIIGKMAEDTDKDFKARVMILTELREVCFDARYDVLSLISLSAPFYDPKDLLKALKVCEVHKSMVLKKFEKYVVSYVAVGSLFRGDATSHDIDVAVVIDDTDVKKMSRAELRDKLGAIIRTIGLDAADLTGVKKSFHIQVYILTDFWESIKEASPVIFTFLRDGVPLYDRGIFMPWKILLEMGRIRPSPESIDLHMSMGERLLERVKGKLLGIVAEDIYYAVLNPSQAALMLYGIPPTTPKETVQLLQEIFVKKEKMLEEKYVKILDKIRKYYKDIEHADIKEVKGVEVDELLKEAEDYLKRITKLCAQIEKKTEHDRVMDFHETTIKIVKDVLSLEGITDVKDVIKEFSKLVKKGKFSENFLTDLKNVVKIKEDYRKMTKQEIEKIRRESSLFIRSLIEYIQRKRGLELERAKIRVKYGDQFGEVYLLDDIAYIVNDIDAKEKVISKTEIMPNGSIGKIKDSSLTELEDAISKTRIPKKVFIKEKIFEDLRKLFGKDVEILVNY